MKVGWDKEKERSRSDTTVAVVTDDACMQRQLKGKSVLIEDRVAPGWCERIRLRTETATSANAAESLLRQHNLYLCARTHRLA